MTRAILIVLDSFGIGGAPDAAGFGDAGADTLGHIAKACAEGRGDREGLRSGSLRLPHLAAWGLGLAAADASGVWPVGLERPLRPRAAWGHAVEQSTGKDTPSGHWEIAGVPVTKVWGYFPNTVPCFPRALTDNLIAKAGLPGILGQLPCLGHRDHRRAWRGACQERQADPLYLGNSVLQIAAHEEAFGLDRLYRLCEIARREVDPLRIGRVIARPFAGSAAVDFVRTANRRDYAMPPPAPTLLDEATAAGREVVSLGKMGDIFAHQGTGRIVKAAGNAALVTATIDVMRTLSDGGLALTNLVDFDTLYGHRRDVAGYAAALEAFDAELPRLEAALRPGDLLVMTADHGCDPTFRGTDHTRECVPVLAFGPGIAGGPIGRCDSFADIGQGIAAHLGLTPLAHGTAWPLTRL